MSILLHEKDLDKLYPAHICVGSDGLIRHTGPSLVRLLGEDMAGKSFFEVFSFERPSRIKTVLALKHTRQELIVRSVKNPAIRLRGSSVSRTNQVLMLVGHVIDQDEGCQLKLTFDDYAPSDQTLDLVMMRELYASLLKDAEQAAVEIEDKRKAAEEANQTKSTFLATVSHEIRTPLNGVLGMADYLASTRLNKKQQDALGIITSSGQNLLTILNQILDLSKVEAGKLDLDNRPFNLKVLVQEAASLFRMKAEEKGLYCRVQVDDGNFIGDEGRVRQILSNLVFNALKFTQEGGVDIRVSYRADKHGLRSILEFEVEDTGIGMEASVLENLFNPFYQGDASVTRRFGGTGLGLAISKQLVELMDGQMWAESTPKKGSIFRFSLSLVPAPNMEKLSPTQCLDQQPTNYDQLSVLIAEDNNINQIVLKTLLERYGIKPVVAQSGREAVDFWKQQNFDLVLMDIRMPIMGGEEACLIIRTLEEAEARPYTPIIAVTANVMKSQVQQYLKVGMDESLAKPIDVSALEDVLWRTSIGDYRRGQSRQTSKTG